MSVLSERVFGNYALAGRMLVTFTVIRRPDGSKRPHGRPAEKGIGRRVLLLLPPLQYGVHP